MGYWYGKPWPFCLWTRALQLSGKSHQKGLVIYCWRTNHPKLRDLNIEKQHLFADNSGIWLGLQPLLFVASNGTVWLWPADLLSIILAHAHGWQVGAGCPLGEWPGIQLGLGISSIWSLHMASWTSLRMTSGFWEGVSQELAIQKDRTHCTNTYQASAYFILALHQSEIHSQAQSMWEETTQESEYQKVWFIGDHPSSIFSSETYWLWSE